MHVPRTSTVGSLSDPRRRASLVAQGKALVARLAKFGVVGGLAYVIDVGIFNLLLYAGSAPLLEGLPIVAKVISAAVATVFSWLGNRYWTFRGRRQDNAGREFVLFAVACTMGLGITLLTLWVSHYVLGFTSPLADNISANLVGVALGSLFRFLAYSRFVFPHTQPASEPDEPDEPSSAPSVVADRPAVEAPRG
jgi:putative flippase GtrA